MDAEAEIEGFDEKSIKQYARKTLDNEQQCEDFLSEAKKVGLIEDVSGKMKYYILGFPLFLHMVCSIFSSEQTLPKTRSEIMQTIIQ